MKAQLMPTDFGKDWKKNIELLSKKYTSTDNINVRSAIEQLVPGLAPMLTDQKKLIQYISEAQKMTNLSGIDFKAVEQYGKEKGALSIAMDNLAIAMTGAALPGLAKAIEALTAIFNSPLIKNVMTGIGENLSQTSDVLTGGGKSLGEMSFEERLSGKFPALGIGLKALKASYQPQENIQQAAAVVRTEQAKQPVQVHLEVHNKSDGSNIDTQIKQKQIDNNKKMTQTTQGSKIN
jgi:hypothetical protein